MNKPATPMKETFSFSADALEKIAAILLKYPADQRASAIMPALTIAQEENGWLSPAAITEVARVLDVVEIRVWEVATFYTMYHLKPVGKHVINVCTTTPCWLRGSDKILRTCKKTLNIGVNETTKDGKFTLKEVECLGACANAPLVEIDGHFFEDLTIEDMKRILQEYAAGKTPKPGPQSGRNGSEPMEDKTSC